MMWKGTQHMARSATTGTTRRRHPSRESQATVEEAGHGSDDPRLHKMSDDSLWCHVDGHDWPKANQTGVEYVHVEEYPNGKVKIGHRRFYCRTCGLPKVDTYYFPYPGAAPQFVDRDYGYKAITNYLLGKDPDVPDRRRPTKADYWAELTARDNPWDRPAGPTKAPRKAAGPSKSTGPKTRRRTLAA